MATRNGTEIALVRVLRSLHDAIDRNERTRIKKKAAELIVELRQFFLNHKAEPDWAGQSWAYRDTMRGCYTAAGYTREQARYTQSGVRFHVSDALRRRLGPDGIAALGMKPESQAQRNAVSSKAHYHLTETARKLTLGRRYTPVRNIVAAAVMLDKVSPDDLAALGDVPRAQMLDALRSIEQIAVQLVEVAELDAPAPGRD